jgi:hypothetical protein
MEGFGRPGLLVTRFATDQARNIVLALIVISHMAGGSLVVADVVGKYIPPRLKMTYGGM